jgi:hypothetical protein
MNDRVPPIYVEGDRSVALGDAARLASEVIAKAFSDATYLDYPFLVKSSPSRSGVSLQDHEEAVHFLTDIDGEWEESRAVWCEMAGLAPSAVRDRAVARLAAIAPQQAARVAEARARASLGRGISEGSKETLVEDEEAPGPQDPLVLSQPPAGAGAGAELQPAG